MSQNLYKFKNFKFYLIGGTQKSTGVSQSSYLLSKIIPSLHNLEVLDLGCGIGYMTIGALYLGARRVFAIDVEDTEKILCKNIKINNFKQPQVVFIKSDLFINLPEGIKFNVIIANLPQHALPATSAAKKLQGKYGGYDGTDLICKALTEGVHFLHSGGKFFGAVSKLTNFHKTLREARTLYEVKIYSKIKKILRKNEMEPYVNYEDLLKHLKKLKKERLIEYKGDGVKKTIKYTVYLCEFTKKPQ